MEVEMPIKNQNDVDHIRKSINILASKNNTSLIFFSIFLLYILISVLNTSDLMLLLPEHTFKMPLIDFDLNLIDFYILAPCLLLMLHFNILFNYNMYLKKLDTAIVRKQIKEETLTPSIYEYAYTLSSKSASGFWIHLFLWIWIYWIPLFILIFIYQRFADYHSWAITILHGVIISLDILFIALSFYYNNKHLKEECNSISMLRYTIYVLLVFTVVMALGYFLYFFKPVIDEYKKDTIEKISKSDAKQFICKITTKIPSIFFGDGYTLEKKDDNQTDYKNCFPRLVVNEAEMAKISPDALYIPRYMIENYKADQNHSNKDKNIEKELILGYGARTNLKKRNLRYADLNGCILTRADLSHSQLQESNLQKVHFQGADLSHTDLRNAILTDTKLDETMFVEANLTGANLIRATSKREVYFSDSDLTDADMNSAILESADFTKARLVRTNISHAKLTNANYTESNLTGASFRESKLNDINFYHATAIGIDFSYVTSNIPFNTIMNLAKKRGGIIINKDKSNTFPDKYYVDNNFTKDVIVIDYEDENERDLDFHRKRILNLNKDKKLRNILEGCCKRLKYLADTLSGQFKKSYENKQINEICSNNDTIERKYTEKTDEARN
jgi:uncharacterized protein YjbI with pentapeptide repeats